MFDKFSYNLINIIMFINFNQRNFYKNIKIKNKNKYII